MSDSREIKKPWWFKKAKEWADELYTRDQKLEDSDRRDLSKKYATISKASVVGAATGLSAGLGGPYAYRYYTTGALKGVKLPRTILLGVVSMVIMRNVAAKIAWDKELKKLDPSGELKQNYKSAHKTVDDVSLSDNSTSVQKKYGMMKFLKYRTAPRWAMYFEGTYQHPDRKFPNPDQMVQDLKGSRRAFPPFFSKADKFWHQIDRKDNDHT